LAHPASAIAADAASATRNTGAILPARREVDSIPDIAGGTFRMIFARMSRLFRVMSISIVAIASGALISACGSQNISVAKSDPTYHGAVLFNQRCSGCHTLAVAATQGSAANVRTREITNGPNFNVRCERPVTRVLYAIENGGFSGATMPQNIVVGQDARDVANFVARYAGSQAPIVTAQPSCASQAIGTLPLATATP
jgi:mono/diheme cytochrome c family protein